jgi:hypothetical protein
MLTTPTASRTRFLKRLTPRQRALLEEVDVSLDVGVAMRAPTEAGRVKRFRRVLENLVGLSPTRRRRLTAVARKKFRSDSALVDAYERWKARG